MFKKAYDKMKGILGAKKDNSTLNIDSDIKEGSVSKVEVEDELYFGTDKYKLEMLKSEIRYKYIPQGENTSSLKNEYISYVEGMLNEVTLDNKDSVEIMEWNKWLSKELNDSCVKIKL